MRASPYKKHVVSTVCRLPLSACDGTGLSPLGCLSPVHGMDRSRCTGVISVWRCLHPSFQKKRELGVVMPSLETEREQKSEE